MTELALLTAGFVLIGIGVVAAGTTYLVKRLLNECIQTLGARIQGRRFSS